MIELKASYNKIFEGKETSLKLQIAVKYAVLLKIKVINNLYETVLSNCIIDLQNSLIKIKTLMI